MNFPETVKKYVEVQCNGEEAYADHEMVDKILSYCPSPLTILELGCGLGRGSVLMNQRLRYYPKFYLLDGDKNEKDQVCGLNHTSHTDFYNSLAATRIFCEANGLNDFVILDAEKDWRRDLPKFDLVFSLLSIGFHWPINLYLDSVYPYLLDEAKLVFQIRRTSDKDPALLEWVDWNYEQVKSVPLDKYKLISIDFGKEAVLILEKK